MKASCTVLALCLASSAPAAEKALPLPAAPVRAVVEDAAAFDAALTGSFRRALVGELPEEDPLFAAWRRTRVGTKLEDQWSRLSGELPWTWESIRRLQPRSVGIALLQVGHLEAVLAVDTPLARLPVEPPAGTARTHAGVAYTLVAAGAADGAVEPSADRERRMGLAWGRLDGVLLVATSERALRLAIDESLAGRGFAAPLPGLISLELDLDALRRDRYFRREFLFPPGPEAGTVRAALRLEEGQLVEVREGTGEPRPAGRTFTAAGAAASAWEPDGSGLWPALRAALLEPVPVPPERPVPPRGALPAAAPRAEQDRYLVNLEQPPPQHAAASWEEGELARWRALWSETPVSGWGYVLERDGTRRIVFPWPAERDEALLALARLTVERRAGRATVRAVGGTRELSVGPGLPALALRRTGAFLWMAPSAKHLEDVAEPAPSADLVRWARVDLEAVRAEGGRWQQAEGPAAPEHTRPLSDRVLGLLGWLPETKRLHVERRRTEAGWSERVVFGAR